MERKATSGIMLTMLFIGMLAVAINIKPINSSNSEDLVVPDDYPTIQEAINNAIEGDTIFVRNGTYYENVVVNKTISLVGENRVITTIDGNYTGNVITVNADNVNITGFTVQRSQQTSGFGILVNTTSNNNISYNVIADNRFGLFFRDSSNNTVFGNNVSFNDVGIYLWNSWFNGIYGNNVTRCWSRGIGLGESWHNLIYGNNLNDCRGWGIGLYDSRANHIYKNNITFCSGDYEICGIRIGDYSIGNLIYENNLIHDWNGIGFDGYGIQWNKIYHNTFIYNLVELFWFPGTERLFNTLDDGYPSGGNYWGLPFAFVDLLRGSYQNETGSDGIGDTSLTWNPNCVDHYPLMKPYAGPHDIGITNLNTSKNIVGQGYRVRIETKVINYGLYSENFDVTIYAARDPLAYVINTTQVNLAGRNSSTIIFAWNTSGFAKGNYTISAYAEPVPDETDTADNAFINGWVYVGMPGDMDANGKIDMKDIRAIAMAFGSFVGHPRYNPNLDITCDGKIDMKDIRAVAKEFGQEDP